MKQEMTSCPICSREAIPYGVPGMYKCTFCGHGFFYPGVKNEKELHKHYDKEYAKDYNPYIKNENFLKRQKQYELDIEFLKRFIGERHVSVLDYGCSTGQFLNAMPASWEKEGFEINKFEIDYIKKNYKDIKVISNLEELEGDSYDVITLRGVIEHLFDFNKIFRIINKSLKKGGIVFICATPDFNSPCSRLYGSLWNQISIPTHYHQFTTTSITILFAKHNFGLNGMEHPYIKTPYADFKNDAIKFIDNVKRILICHEPVYTKHAYPGTMMSMIFKKMR